MTNATTLPPLGDPHWRYGDAGRHVYLLDDRVMVSGGVNLTAAHARELADALRQAADELEAQR